VYLPPEAKAFVTATNHVQAKVISRDVQAEHITAEVEASAPAMVVLSQAYYHLWHAYVDDKPVPLLRANYAFQAIEVPAGRHKVRLDYEDKGFQLGVVISIASLVLCLGLWIWGRRDPTLHAQPPVAVS
jgi:uncharacterized membrane protein YfhO